MVLLVVRVIIPAASEGGPEAHPQLAHQIQKRPHPAATTEFHAIFYLSEDKKNTLTWIVTIQITEHTQAQSKEKIHEASGKFFLLIDTMQW